MKISYNWLKQYADIDLTAEELSKVLTDTGLEVEGLVHFESIKGGLKGVKIGKVLTCKKHPNADKLSVTTVDVGSGSPLPIVCGAPNVAEGQTVLVATVGTTLHMGDESFEIKKAKIRGEVSEGMICAEDELGLGTSHEGIMVLDDSFKIGAPASDYFEVTEDDVFEIGLTPNRTDAMAHLGVARDIVAALNRKGEKKYSLGFPDVSGFEVDNSDLTIPVEIKDITACPRYSGLTISGLTVKESPAWLKNYLLAIGIRPINNIVDITNYVMMELGQPLHAFDAAKIKGRKVVIRLAKNKEKFVTLDEEERELTEKDLMICDAEDPMCIGGVFGGIGSGVTEATKEIFLESAYFNPVFIRKTAKHHSLQTDASFRFERGADPEMTILALKRAALLIKEVAGGLITSRIHDAYPAPLEWPEIRVRYKQVDRLVGKHIPPAIIGNVLNDLGFKVENEDGEGITVKVPLFKSDVTREADVIEEILRIYGYNNIEIPGTLKSSLSFAPKPDPEKYRALVASLLTDRGFSEIMSNSLTTSSYTAKSNSFNEDLDVKMLNPLSSDLNVMRQDLLFGGLEAIRYNRNRKSFDLKLFEFGRTYRKSQDPVSNDTLSKYIEKESLAIFLTGRKYPVSWNRGDEAVDFYDLKGYVSLVLERLGFTKEALEFSELKNDIYESGYSLSFHHKVLCSGGQLSKKWLNDFDIKQPVYYASLAWDTILAKADIKEVQYEEVSKYPEVKRDLALMVDCSVKFADIEKEAFACEKVLLKSVRLFDVYEGDKIEKGKKSYAVSFTLQDERKTLTDKVIDKTMQKLIRSFEEKFGAAIRK